MKKFRETQTPELKKKKPVKKTPRQEANQRARDLGCAFLAAHGYFLYNEAGDKEHFESIGEFLAVTEERVKGKEGKQE